MDLPGVLRWVGSSFELASRSVPPTQIILHIYADKKGPETVVFVILAEAMVFPEESQNMPISLGWQEQVLLSSNFIIRHLVFLLFIFFLKKIFMCIRILPCVPDAHGGCWISLNGSYNC